MGNDGGSIPKRRELVKEAARNPTIQQLKETRNEQQDHSWNVDPLSQNPLARPVVSDSLGRLFNKESVLQYLLPPEDDDAASRRAEQDELLQGAVTSLKDVVEVKFHVEAPAADSKSGGARRSDKWTCPVTQQELGPGAKAVYIVPCGHAFAGAAIKEISSERCLSCNEPFASNDVIPILPIDEIDIARLALRIKRLKENGLSHSLKSTEGKKKRKKLADSATAEAVASVSADASHSTSAHSKNVDVTTTVVNGIKNASTASLTQKVLQEQEERNKRRKTDKNDNIDSLFSRPNDPTKRKISDISFMNRGYSIPNRQ